MTIQEPIIKFYAVLRTTDNKMTTSRDDLQIEFYDYANNVWQVLIETISVKRGRFTVEFDTTSREVVSNETFKPFLDALKVNNFPMVRLSKPQVRGEKIPSVVAMGGIVNSKVDADLSTINVFFGSLWLTEENVIKRDITGPFPTIEHNLIGQPTPATGTSLYSAFLAALNETDKFKDYIVGESTVVIKANDDPTVATEELVAQLRAELTAEKEKVINLNTQLEGEQGKVRELNIRVEELTENFEIAQNDNEGLTAEVVRLKGTLEEATTALGVEKEKVRILEIDLREKNIALEEQIGKVITLERNVSVLTNDLTVEKGKVTELQTNVDRLEIQLAGAERKFLAASNALTEEKAKVVELNKAVDGLNEAIMVEKANVSKLQTDVEGYQADISRLEGEKEDILGREATPANEIFGAIVDEVQIASEKSAGGRFSVSNLKINLKTHVKQDGDGFKLQLIDSARADFVKDGTVSDLQLDLISQEPTPVDTPALVMPKVIGLTETAARNRLRAFGLNIKAIYQPSSGAGKRLRRGLTIGQAFKQSPEAGEDITAGETVTVIFAKDINNFN